MTDDSLRLVEYTYPGCGHTRRVQRRTADKHPQVCWPCREPSDEQRAADALERKRASARASYHRRKGAAPLTDEQRHAQRSLVGFTNVAHFRALPDLVWWPRPLSVDHPNMADAMEAVGMLTTSTAEVLEWLDVLGVPASVFVVGGRGDDIVTRVRVDNGTRARGGMTIGELCDGIALRVGRSHRLAPAASVDELERWLPTLAQRARQVAGLRG